MSASPTKAGVVFISVSSIEEGVAFMPVSSIEEDVTFLQGSSIEGGLDFFAMTVPLPLEEVWPLCQLVSLKEL